MKFIIFEPHPDDLLFGAGPIIFNWIEECHEIHVITVTDGRACYRGHIDIKIKRDEVAKMRIGEAKKAIEYLELSPKNHHLLNFPDAKASKFVKEGIEKVKIIIEDADRLLIPSNTNSHLDHQATHDIAMGAAKELGLDIEYYVYFIPSYGVFKDDSKDKQIEIVIDDELRIKLQDWLQIYQSQKRPKTTWKFYTNYLKRVKKIKFAIFRLEDKGKYYNF